MDREDVTSHARARWLVGGAAGVVGHDRTARTFRTQLDSALTTQAPDARRAAIQSAISAATSTIESTPRNEMASLLSQMNEDLKALGLKVNNNDGDVRLVVDKESARAALGEDIVRQATYDLTLNYYGEGGRADAENMANQTKKGLEELERRERQIGEG